MESDLSDESTLQYYWSHTGGVATYWITSRDFVATFPGVEIPGDLALYDRQLLITFDEQTKMLAFDVLKKESGVGRLFDDVDRLKQYNVEFLHELPLPNYLQ
jgi:hypothetical protein